MAGATTIALFARGIVARLALWPALRLAVDEQWGGPESAQKRTWLASVLVDAFEEHASQPQQYPKPDVYYVEETLLQAMEDEFDVVLEDGSAEAVAKDVVRMWEEVGVEGGSDGIVRGFEEQAAKVKGKKVQAQRSGDSGDEEDWSDDGEEGSEEESMDTDPVPTLVPVESAPKKPEPEVDEDGFTTVKAKGKSHR